MMKLVRFSLDQKPLRLLFLFFFLIVTISSTAQKNKIQDSLLNQKQKIDADIQKLSIENLKENEANFKANVLFNKQSVLLNAIDNEINNTNYILKEGINYKGYSKELELIVNWKENTIKGVTKNSNQMQTSRDLTSTSLLFNELLKRTNLQLDKIAKKHESLSNLQRKIDSLASQKILYELPNDDNAKRNYFERMKFLTKDLNACNLNIKNAIDSIQTLQIKGNLFKHNLQLDIADIENKRNILNEQLVSGKSDVLAYLANEKVSVESNFSYSTKKGFLLLFFYVFNEKENIYALLFFIVIMTMYLRIIRGKYKKANLFENIQYPGHVLNYPFASSVLILTSIFQFFLPLPPFVFTAILWLIIGLALSYIIYKSLPRRSFYNWMFIFIMNIIAFQNNLTLLFSKNEMTTNLIMSCLGIVYGSFLIYNKYKAKDEKIEPSIYPAFIVFILLEALSFYFNIQGAYNFSKLLMINGYFTLFIFFFLYISFSLSKDIFNFSKYLKEDHDEQLKTVEETTRLTPMMYLLLFVGWYYLISRNTFAFQNFIEPFAEIFYKKRTISDFNYSFDGIAMFIFILYLSGMAARIISFLANDTKSSDDNERKTGLGSYLLLIRIAILTIGTLIAFVSIGIPMDKITLMISALSVGIGFGLQSLINNLVSGLIIAFEKPVNLNDIIEVGNKMGTMKSIGIRSSVITTWDGADVIIPNGDLLNQHLVNWTMGNNRRRYEIDLGVAYGTDLNLVKSILTEVLQEHHLVLKNPTPMVWVTKFGESSVDFAIKYWVPHFNFGNDVKNDIIIAIDNAFKTNGIEIPFPQRDLHIISKESEKNEEKEDQE